MSYSFIMDFSVDSSRLYDARFDFDDLKKEAEKWSEDDQHFVVLYHPEDPEPWIKHPEELMSYLYQLSVKNEKLYKSPLVTFVDYELSNSGEDFLYQELEGTLIIPESSTDLVKKIVNSNELVFDSVLVDFDANYFALCLDTDCIPMTYWSGGGMRTTYKGHNYHSLSPINLQYRTDVCEKNSCIFLDEKMVDSIKEYFNIPTLYVTQIAVDMVERMVICFPDLKDVTPLPDDTKDQRKGKIHM